MRDIDLVMMLSSFLSETICKYCDSNGKCNVVDIHSSDCEKGISEYLEKKREYTPSKQEKIK